MATATAKRLKIRPLDDRVLIERNEAEEMTSGGIVLPDNAREKPQQGKVIATGPGKLLEKTGERGQMSVKKGDSVFYGKYSGTEVELDGDTYVILRESDILAISN
ncbi:MAG: co-chaperone GroES [Planctomycetes bacterium]|nr:co-chaperone GroES [Planctomycetota bacterium]